MELTSQIWDLLVSEHVPLHSKLICENFHVCLGVQIYAPIKLGGGGDNYLVITDLLVGYHLEWTLIKSIPYPVSKEQ